MTGFAWQFELWEEDDSFDFGSNLSRVPFQRHRKTEPVEHRAEWKIIAIGPGESDHIRPGGSIIMSGMSSGHSISHIATTLVFECKYSKNELESINMMAIFE